MTRRLLDSTVLAAGLLLGYLMARGPLEPFFRLGIGGDVRDLESALILLAALSLLYVLEPSIWRAALGADEEILAKRYFLHAGPILFWIPGGLLLRWVPAILTPIPFLMFLGFRLAAAMRSRPPKDEKAETARFRWIAPVIALIPFAGFVHRPLAGFAAGGFLLVLILVRFSGASAHRRMFIEAGIAGIPYAAALFLKGSGAVILDAAFLFATGLFVSVSARKKDIARYAIMMWALCAFFLVLFESAIRQTDLNNRLIPRDVLRGPASGDDFKIVFREGEPNRTKSPGAIRILCLGGSSTWGDGVEARQAWPRVLESILREKGYQAEVVNTGVPGSTTLAILHLLRTQLLPYSPDVIMLYAGFNDMNVLPGPFSQRELWEMAHDDRRNAKRMMVDLQRVLSHSRLYGGMRLVFIRARGSSNVLRMVPGVSVDDFVRNVKEINDVCKAHGIRFLAMTEFSTNEDATYHSGLAKLAERERFGFKDLYAEMRQAAGDSKWLLDAVHLTAQGNRKVAQEASSLLFESGGPP